jgi:hypothetical protein
MEEVQLIAFQNFLIHLIARSLQRGPGRNLLYENQDRLTDYTLIFGYGCSASA